MNKSHCPKVFIIILNYNGQDVLRNCLSSVFRIDYPNFEVVLVDNNSRDGSLEMAKNSFSRAHIIKNEENLGFSAGNNVGIKLALEKMADYALLLNYDTEVEKDFLAKLVNFAESQKEAGIFSPLIFKGKTKEIWFSGGHIDWLRMKTIHNEKLISENSFESGYICGCAMLIKAEVFRKIGLLDEDFFLYWEDADFSVRSKKAGFKNMMVPQSRVYHFEKSEQAKSNKIYWLVISGLIFFKKNTPRALKPWIFTYTILRKIKNRIDIKRKNKEIAFTVKKAYGDFGKSKI